MRSNEDGQHRSSGGIPSDNGQRQRPHDPRSRVGDASGGELHNTVPPSRRDGDISTTTKSAGPLSPGERRGGGDDRR